MVGVGHATTPRRVRLPRTRRDYLHVADGILEFIACRAVHPGDGRGSVAVRDGG
ncbi:hypothetical protein [Streptomyces bottropensis]|uniref:hypothetical protein n=1 Tax=Streptomyces bottropensis TaxID=42235 RepID=UPI0036B14B12